MEASVPADQQVQREREATVRTAVINRITIGDNAEQLEARVGCLRRRPALGCLGKALHTDRMRLLHRTPINDSRWLKMCAPCSSANSHMAVMDRCVQPSQLTGTLTH